MTRVLNKVLLTITALSTFAALSVGFSFSSAKAETTECTQIASLPAIITVQGIYCFKTNLVTSITTGNAINIQANNVTIDMNGFKLGGATAGAGTQAIGIYANNRKNVTIINGSIRGFYRGIWLDESAASGSSGHLIEHIRADGNKFIGFVVEGSNNIIRNNHVINTGGGTVSTSAFGISITSVNNTLVADNEVSAVSETGATYGIFINGGTRLEVRGNSIFEIKDGTSNSGITILNSSGVTIRENRITNAAGTGSLGISDSSGTSTSVACIDNVTIGYTTATFGCDLLSGHQSL